MKSIVQSKFIRGLNNTFGIFSQPEGTVPRISNLVMSKRGSLVTVDGSQILAQGNLTGGSAGNFPMWLELFLFQQLGGLTAGTRQIFGLLHFPTTGGPSNQVQLVSVPVLNPTFPTFNPNTSPNPIFNFGAITGLISIDSFDGGIGGGGGGPNQGQYMTALQFASLPMILEFNTKMIICLGSKTPIYQSDGTFGGTSSIGNTFSAQYPSWQASVNWLQGDLIQVTISTVLYIFKAIQGGNSGTTAPAFSAVLNSTVADNQVIWQNVGVVTASPAPRGAAHGINYAGSLWVANTSPSTTTDGLDGPSAIRMSDINNQNSWNPLNSAQIAKDDGTEITGFASFTIAEVGISPTGSLIVFKQFSTFQIIGVFGSTNLTIQPMQTDLGCIAPRSIQFVPGFGILRLSHLGFALTNGVNDKLMCEEIRPYLFGGEDDDSDIVPVDWNYAWFSKAAQTIDPPMYVCACPIIGGQPLQALTGVSANTTSLASSFGGQSWYVKVSAFGQSLYEWAISPEFGPFVLNSLTSLQVTIPAYPVGASSLYIYMYQKDNAGRPINGYRQQSAAPASSVVTIQNLGGFLPGIPPSGVIGALTRLFCFDLVLRAWAIVDLPWPISVLKQFRSLGSVPITVTGGFQDQTIRRVFSGDVDWDGFPIKSSMRTRELYGEGGSQELFMRQTFVRGFGQTAAAAMTITPTYDGNDDPAQSVGFTALGNNQFQVQLDLQRIARNVHLTLNASGPIEIDAIEFEYEPCEIGAPIIIA